MARVLVVDDKEENRYYLQTLLKGHGFEVDVARHGAEALVKARQAPPALAISDLLMPVMDGYTLLRHWRSDAVLRPIPFIVYTATYTEPQDEQLALDLGADAFVLKPAEPERILAEIEVVRARLAAPAVLPAAPSGDELETLKLYSQTLIRKLEEKSLQLEEANRALQRDLDERKAVESALRQSEAEFRILADALPQMVWIASPRGHTVYVNRHWNDYTGLAEPDERDGWAAPLHADDRETVLATWRDALRAGTPWSAEARLKRADDAWRWWLIRAVPERDEKGGTIKWVGTCTDIEDLRHTQQQLRQSQRLELVGQLTGGIAHDFNNILNVILANAESLAEADDLPVEIVERVDRIAHSVRRASELVRSLLAFSRKQPLKPRAVDVNELVARTGKLLRRSLGEHVELSEDLDDGLWTVSIDRAQLEAALLNLCVNARDAMPDGGRLSIRTFNTAVAATRHPDAVAGDHVVLEVRDSGSGMAPDVLARVFEPFFTTKPEGKGTGLGLSMVYGFVRQSRGHVEIDSELGRGTAVRLFLPRAEGAPDQAESLPRAPVVQRRHRVLLVEDDPQVRAAVLLQLQGLGCDVTEANGGAAGIVAMESAERPYDVLLTDVVMPGTIDGRALAEEVGRRWPHTRIVFMSGYPRDAIAADGRLLPGVLLINKPFRKADLAQILDRALEKPADN
ncbi:MAG: response regulator [Enhydrobacter sp.]|nr:MAG: response regulator [Enhydrobacter sp.]